MLRLSVVMLVLASSCADWTACGSDEDCPSSRTCEAGYCTGAALASSSSSSSSSGASSSASLPMSSSNTLPSSSSSAGSSSTSQNTTCPLPVLGGVVPLRRLVADDVAVADNALVRLWPAHGGVGLPLTRSEADDGVAPIVAASAFGCHAGVRFRGGGLHAVALNAGSVEHTIIVVATLEHDTSFADQALGLAYVGSGQTNSPERNNSALGFYGSTDTVWIGGYGQPMGTAMSMLPTPQTPHVFSKVVTGSATTAASATGYIDGAQRVAATTLDLTNLDGDVGVGGHWANVNGVQGNLRFVAAEVLFFDRGLTDEERRAIECPLAAAYGVTMACSR